MNTDQVYNLIQKLVVLAAGGLIAKGFGDSSIWEAVGGAVAGLITWYISHKWNAAPTAAETGAISTSPAGVSQSNQSMSGRILFGYLCALSLLFAVAAMWLVGCAHIQAGQDPIVVNAERAQTYAASTFDLVLGVDNSNRSLWKSKAPAFHDFCEWLRQPQLAYLADGTATNVQRDIAMQLNLDKVKLDYKASKVSSNALLEAIATLKSAEQQANSWLIVLTNDAPVQPPAAIRSLNPGVASAPAVLLMSNDSTNYSTIEKR